MLSLAFGGAESSPVNHWPRVRDKPGFLRRLMDEFVGGSMSLEGDLSRCSFPPEVVLATEELGVLQRNTLWPRQAFVVLRLEPGTLTAVFKQVMAGGLRAIVHVQIERAGVLQLGAYDNFHSECVFTGPGISAAILSVSGKGDIQDN